MARLLAIDYGLKRTGIAVTDPLKIIATPLQAVTTAELDKWLLAYCTQEQVEAFIVGWPTNTDGSATDTTPHVKGFLKRLQKAFPAIPVYKVDERFSSVQAHQALRATGANKKIRHDKGLVDQVSAAILLQAYMEGSRRFDLAVE